MKGLECGSDGINVGSFERETGELLKVQSQASYR